MYKIKNKIKQKKEDIDLNDIVVVDDRFGVFIIESKIEIKKEVAA